MIDDRPLSADRVPTLTEVVELDLPAQTPGEQGAGRPLVTDETGDGSEAHGAASAVEPLPERAAPGAGDGAPPAVAPGAAAATAMESDQAQATAEVEGEVTSAPAPVAAAGTPAAIEPPNTEAPPAAVVSFPAIDADAVVAQVLAELTPRIDMLLESRLREALAPALARAADGLIRDTRANLSVAVRDLVQEAVDRALQRRAEL